MGITHLAMQILLVFVHLLFSIFMLTLGQVMCNCNISFHCYADAVHKSITALFAFLTHNLCCRHKV